jgi:hypothetical protein
MKEDEMNCACSIHGELRNEYKTVVGNLGRRSPLGKFMNRLEDDIERDLMGRCGLDSSGSGIGTNGRLFEHGIDPSGSKKGREFLQ